MSTAAGPGQVIDHVVASITPASAACASEVERRVRRGAATAELGSLERLAVTMAGAQHTARPRGERPVMVVVAGDRLPATVAAIGAILDGKAALATVCRDANAPIILADACTEADIDVGTDAAPDSVVVRLGLLAESGSEADASELLAIAAGIALAVSIADQGTDLISVGCLGSETSAATAALAGLMLGAASMNIPVVLDDAGTSAAAVVAARYAPDVTGYLVAAHAGSTPSHRVALAALGLAPLFPVGLAQGEGTGAALVLGMARATGRLLG